MCGERGLIYFSLEENKLNYWYVGEEKKSDLQYTERDQNRVIQKNHDRRGKNFNFRENFSWKRKFRINFRANPNRKAWCGYEDVENQGQIYKSRV